MPKKCLHTTLLILIFLASANYVFGWGSTKKYRYEPTHQQIVRWAYDLLEQDQFVDLGDFYEKSEVLEWDWVVAEGGKVTGTGPDADGKSNYSMHYYNPSTGQGGGPEAVAKYFKLMLDPLTEDAISHDRYLNTAWTAHFLADMNVPYHVIGISLTEAISRIENPVFTEEFTGPHKLYRYPTSDSVSLFGPPQGFGGSNNFQRALDNFLKSRGKDSAVDWFDPWYLNGATHGETFSLNGRIYDVVQIDDDFLKLATGSHAFWEVMVTAFYDKSDVTPELNKLIQDGQHYDPLWVNPKVEWGDDPFKNTVKHSNLFASRVANRTRSKIIPFWNNPSLALAHAVRSVATLFKASMTTIGVAHDIDEIEPGNYVISLDIYNNGHELLNDVEARITIDGVDKEIKSMMASIPRGSSGRLNWNYRSVNGGLAVVDAEVHGHYFNTPDLGYKRGFFSFETQAMDPESILEDEPDSNNPFDGLFDIQDMTFSILTPEGEDVTEVAAGDRLYPQVHVPFVTAEAIQEFNTFWSITDPVGDSHRLNSGSFVEGEGWVLGKFQNDLRFSSQSKLGNYRVTLSVRDEYQELLNRKGNFELLPLFGDYEFRITNLPDNPESIETFRPGDPIAFVINFEYNSMDPEKKVSTEVKLAGPDHSIKSIESVGEHQFTKGLATLHATGQIPDNIQEGLNTVDIELKCGEDSIHMRERFWVRHPVEFIAVYTTKGDDQNFRKKQFGIADEVGYFMQYRFKHLWPEDNYGSGLGCSVGGNLLPLFSSPVFGPDPINMKSGEFFQTFYHWPVPENTPDGSYQLNGYVWVNGVRYESGNAYFKIGSKPTIEILSPSMGFEVDKKVMIVSGTCEDKNLRQATLIANGQTYPVKLDSGNFSIKVVLRPGRNDIRVHAENGNGESSDSVTGTAYINASVLKVVLIWEAAKTDLDMWITDPEGVVTSYKKKAPAEGRKLDIDDRDGPGTETYTMELPMRGNYQVEIRYFADDGYVGPVSFQLMVTRWETTQYESHSSATGQLMKSAGDEREPGSTASFNVDL